MIMATTGVSSISVSASLAGVDLQVKSEPGVCGLFSRLQSEEDVYEETGDLEFFQSTHDVFLTKVPKFLWKSWSQLDDGQEVHLGTIRVEGDVEDPKRMSLLLASDTAFNENVPKEYNIQPTNGKPINTFIFSEKDLAGYSNKAKASANISQDRGSLPFSQVAPRAQIQERGRTKIDKNQRWQPYHRKAIPKKTALIAHVQRELIVLPVENEEYRRLMNERAMEVFKSKRETQILIGHASAHGGNLLAPGTLGAPGGFKTFIKPAGAPRGKPSELKAARIPQNELLDLIGDCFKRYTYWPLKALKVELKQPETYLKQTLEMVAHLVRQGPHAMTWQLNRDSKFGAYAEAGTWSGTQDQTAPDTGYNIDGGSDTGEGAFTEAEDEPIMMEDVMKQ